MAEARMSLWESGALWLPYFFRWEEPARGLCLEKDAARGL